MVELTLSVTGLTGHVPKLDVKLCNPNSFKAFLSPQVKYFISRLILKESTT